MTPIVARTFQSSVHLLGDTKLSFEDVLKGRPLTRGALKCIAISPNTCVSFAGDKGVAEKSFAQLFSNKGMNRDTIREHLLATCRHRDAVADFIVATADSAHPFDRIENGTMEVEMDTAWIGSAPAFRELQRLSLSAEYRSWSDPDDIIYPVEKAMDTILHDGRFESVGGFKVHLVSRPDSNRGPGFRYQTYAAGFDMKTVENTTEPTSLLQSRGPEGGSYRYVVNVPSDPGIGAIGVYIAEGLKGVLYYPEFDWNARIYADATYAQFVEAVRIEANLDLTGLGFST